MANWDSGTIAALAGAGGMLVAKSADYILSRRKNQTDETGNFQTRLLARIESLEQQLEDKDEECQKRLDKLHERVDALQARVNELIVENAKLERERSDKL